MLKTIAITLALSVAAAGPLAAQGKSLTNDRIPPGMRPPPGMCRIWLDGVPPGQQPAPTDCPTAVRNRPANGRVIFGDDYDTRSRKKAKSDRDDERRTAPRDDRDDRDDEIDDDRDDGDDDRVAGRRGGRSDVCVDADRDGRCDDVYARGDRQCVDLDRDGNCDDPYFPSVPAPRTLPEMMSAVMITRGTRPVDIGRWLGGGVYTPHYVARDRTSAPQRVTWLDENGQVVQVWVDRDHDGRADVVEVYEQGRRTRTYRQ